MDINVRIWVVQIVDEALYLSGETGLEVEELAAPQLALLEDAEVEASDDAEVTASAFERNPQVPISFGIGIHDLSTREDNFIIDNVVANETTSIGEVR